jgi:hypothetical protein
MHSTRIATFLLGAWMACCVFVDMAALQTLRLASLMMNVAIPAAAEIIQNAGREPMGQLLHHFAAEQYRYYLPLWGMIQLVGILALAGLLYFAAEKRILPQILCLAIFVLVVFQLAINPELAYRGREADFPPGSLSLGTQARVLALAEVWAGVEIVKLIVGGVLAVILFSFRSTRRSRRSVDPATPVHVG